MRKLFRCIKNWFITRRYPFLKMYNVMTGKFMGYNCIWSECIPDGWNKAFGKDLVKDLRRALVNAQKVDPKGGYPEKYITNKYDSKKIIPYLKGFRIRDIKEKFGELRIYHSGAPEEVDDVIEKYTDMSAFTCIECGKPAKFISQGWICPYCEDCAEEDCVPIDKWYKVGSYNII